MTATQTTKPTKFVTVSPFTGETATRKSKRAYTHALWAIRRTDDIVASLLRQAEYQEQQVAEYTETAAHLRAGTTPAAGSVLLNKRSGGSYNEQKAGVRTEWDSVMYSLNNPIGGFAISGRHAGDRDALAASYEGMADGCALSAAQYRQRAAEAKAANMVRESCTFHHSAALAAKAVTQYSHMAVETRVAEVTVAAK